MIAQELQQWIQQAIRARGFPSVDFSLEHPSDLSHGDYASNVALVLAKQLGKNPREVAEVFMAELAKAKPSNVEATAIAGPGFINISLTKEFFAESLKKATERTWGSNKESEKKTVMVEYTQPNPFKPFHIGHLMSNAIGESLARLFENSGAKVVRANYQGDVGLHIAKALWGAKKLNVSVKDPLEIGKAYAYGNEQYEKDEAAQADIISINRALYEKSDPVLTTLYQEGRTASLEHFENIYRKLGTKFDQYYFESEAAEPGKKLVEQNVGRVFEPSDGAVVYRGEKHGLHTRVFITREGFPTYEAKEIGLAKLKQERAPAHNAYITVTASEQTDIFKVTTAAITELFPEYGSKIQHVSHGMMRFASGKMSSRKGNVITGESLIEDVEEMVKERMKETRVEDSNLATAVAVGAIKYSILKQSAGKDIVFDLEKSVSLEGDSGPYLMYTHARANSILEKAKASKITPATKKPDAPYAIERLLYRFPEVVQRAAKEYEPHYVTTYLTQLAGAFNSFYGSERIVDDPEFSGFKVALTSAVANTLQKGLWLLGVHAPTKM